MSPARIAMLLLRDIAAQAGSRSADRHSISENGSRLVARSRRNACGRVPVSRWRSLQYGSLQTTNVVIDKCDYSTGSWLISQKTPLALRQSRPQRSPGEWTMKGAAKDFAVCRPDAAVAICKQA